MEISFMPDGGNILEKFKQSAEATCVADRG